MAWGRTCYHGLPTGCGRGLTCTSTGGAWPEATSRQIELRGRGAGWTDSAGGPSPSREPSSSLPVAAHLPRPAPAPVK